MHFFLRKHPIFQTVVLFIMVVAGGLWRTTCFLEDYNVSFSDAPETFEAVVETQPVEKERSVKCQLAVTKGRLAGHSIIAFFPKKDYQYEDDGTGVESKATYAHIHTQEGTRQSKASPISTPTTRNKATRKKGQSCTRPLVIISCYLYYGILIVSILQVA